jgi:hypothetical protein
MVDVCLASVRTAEKKDMSREAGVGITGTAPSYQLQTVILEVAARLASSQ